MRCTHCSAQPTKYFLSGKRVELMCEFHINNSIRIAKRYGDQYQIVTIADMAKWRIEESDRRVREASRMRARTA